MNTPSGPMRLLDIQRPVKRFRRRVFFYLMLLSLATSAISAGAFYRRQTRSLERERGQRAATLLSNMATQVELGTYAHDASLLDLPIRRVFREPDVVFVAVYDLAGSELIRLTDPSISAPPAPVLSHLHSVLKGPDALPLRLPSEAYDDLWLGVFTKARPAAVAMFTEPGLTGERPEAVGLVRIGLSLKPATQQLNEVIHTGVYLGLTLLVLGAIVSILIAGRISDPILLLSRTADQIAAGNLDVEIPVTSDDEVGHLARSFRHMAAHLKEILAKMEDMNRGLEAEVQNRTEEIRHTAALSQELNAPIATEATIAEEALVRLLEPALAALQAGARVDACAILLPREESVEFELYVAVTRGAPMSTFVTMPSHADLKTGEPLRTWNGVTVPILFRGEPEGALVLVGENLPHTAVDFAIRAQSQLAIAISNVRAFAALRHMAHELTLRNAALVKQRDQLEEMNRLKSEFLANVSHELRTPMNAILGYAELIHDGIYGPTTPDQVEGLDGILDSGRNLLSLIGQILDLSKVESGHMEVSLAPLDLVDIAEAVAHETAPLTRSKPYKTRVLSTERVRIVSDPTKLKQILTNLVANAIKFTEAGKVDIQVLPITDGLAQIRVIDSGIGIQPEHQKLIFEEFRQVDGSSTRKYGGTGLGLAIARRFALLLSGNLTVESKHGVGSTFTLFLPPDPRHHQRAPMPPPVTSGNTGRSSVASLKQEKIS